MREHIRSIFHFVLLFIFIFSQVTVQSASAAMPDQPDTETFLQGEQSVPLEFSEAMPGPAPAEKGSVVASAESFKTADSILGIAADMQLLGYTLPSYNVYSMQNGLSIEPLVAYNLVVDSNVLSPSSYGPSAATFGAKFCNTGASNLTNVWAYIGNYDADYNGTLGDVTPGSFPRRGETAPSYDDPSPETVGDPFSGAYGSGTTNPLVGTTLTDYGVTNAPFALQLASGTTPPEVDASRYVGTLAAGECKTQYWMITYPRKACSSGAVCDLNNTTRKDVTGGVKPDDDLWLPYFFWGTSTSGATTATSYRWNAVTMRNEITAMANKIWPNGDNKVPDQYVQAIQQVLGWDTWTSSDPDGGTIAQPGEAIVSQGIWYDLGNVGAGFDNNGDFVPDRNVWLQPIGDASAYDPGCFRLVRTYGLVVVKLNDGTELLLPFVDQMYFENIPENNTGAVGLVFYEYVALDGACTANLTPYQEVASGYDNEKFNADFGAGVPPIRSQQSTMTFDKTGPASAEGIGNTQIAYSLTFTLPDVDPANTLTTTIGSPSTGNALTFVETVPPGMALYSASSSVTMTNYATPQASTLLFSTDSGATWSTTQPASTVVSTSPNALIKVQWRLANGITSPADGPSVTGTVNFVTVVPSAGYSLPVLTNTACLAVSSADPFLCDTTTTLMRGSYNVSGTVFCDDGAQASASGACSTGTASSTLGNGILDLGGGEPGMPNVDVSLYYDSNANGALDSADLLVSTMSTFASRLVDNGRVDVSGNGIVGDEDDGLLNGVNFINGYADLNGDGVINASDAGTYAFAGYSVIAGALDLNGNSSIDTTGATDDGNLLGKYDFRKLPNGTYFTKVSLADTDIQATYGLTTLESLKATVSSASVRGLDFGFAPPLTITKALDTTGAINVGQPVQYTVTLRNNLPGGSGVGNSCTYTMWSTKYVRGDESPSQVPAGGGNNNEYFQSVTNLNGSPDGVNAYTNLANSDNTVGIKGFNADPVTLAALSAAGASITKVEYQVLMSERTNLKSDADVLINTYYNGNGNGTTSPNATAYANSAAGTLLTGSSYFTYSPGYLYTYTSDITTLIGQTWTVDDFRYDNVGLQMVVGKGTGSNSGNLNVDAAALRVTVNQACANASSTTLDPVPLSDSFPTDYLNFVSANPPPSSYDETAGTINWTNVGPIPAGSYKQVQVSFTATAPTTAQQINTASSLSPKFVNGLAANDVSATAPLNVGNLGSGSISGRVFDDNNTTPNGWVFSAGCTAGSGTTCSLETGDTALQGVRVSLLACVRIDGTLETNSGSKTCTGEAATNAWLPVQTQYTNSTGDYSFTGLAVGTYRVVADSTLLPGSSQTADPTVTSPALCSTGGNCDHQSYGDINLGLMTTLGRISGTNAITNVNFGYNVPSTTYSIGDEVFYDWNGNGVRDAGDEIIPGVTVRLYNASGTEITPADVTDATGTHPYEFTLVNGIYTVRVATSTFPAGQYLTQTGDPDQAAQKCTVCDNASTYTLNGANYYNLDFGYQPNGSGSIGDTVFKDMNGDGYQSGAQELGIPNITVDLLVNFDGINPTDPNSWVIAKTTSTDAGGKYSFSNLPDGTYRVRVNTSDADLPKDSFGVGYQSTNGSQYTALMISGGVVTSMTNPSGATSTTANGFGDTVENDPLYLDADFGFAPLAAIGDTVYWDSNGDGTQEAGEPGINGVVVHLYTFIDELNGKYDSGETYTDSNSNGRWDRAESFTDLNNNGTRDTGEPFTDRDGDGLWDAAEAFVDATGHGGDGRYNPGESFFTDTNGNGDWDTGETRSTDPASVTPAAASTTATSNGQDGKYLFSGLDTDPTGVGYVVIVDTGAGSPVNGRTLTADPGMDGVICPASGQPVCDSREGQLLYPGSNYMGADFGYLPAGVLGDTLWIDTDNDGVRAPTEVGIDNVTVRLCTVPSCATGTVVATTATDANGNYFFTNISAGTYYVAVDTTDTDLTGLGVAQTFERYNGGSADDNPTNPENITQVVVGTVGGSAAVTSINGTDCTDCGLDVDFGYRYAGPGNISGTICLETTVDGVCGIDNLDNSGVGAGETAYDNVTVYLYKLNDTNNDGILSTGETTVLVSSTVTNSNGDYSFTGVTSGVYYIIAIGAPQDDLDLTSSAGSVNGGATSLDDSETTSYVETTAFDGDTLSAYQVVRLNVTGFSQGDDTAVDRDFTFKLDGSYDFGDLPQGSISGVTYVYSTLLGGTPDGPRHLVPATPDLYLGSGVDVDPDGFATASGANADTEENGVTIGTDNSWGDGSGQLNFTIHGSGWLVGWIDFNADGDFADTREVVINQAVSGNLTNYNVLTPYNGTTILPPTSGYLYARFRLFASQPPVSALAYTGAATNGEVEDYRFPINSGGTTTPVTVAYFYARRQGSTVIFEWSTATETGNIGFNLYAEGRTGLVQLNRQLIASRVVDSHDKQDYRFSLDVGGSLFYIEDVSVLGETRLHGPFGLGQKYGGLQKTDKIDQVAILSEHVKKTANYQTWLRKGMKLPASATQNPAWLSWFSTLQLTTTLNLEVRKTGIYRVSYEMLKDAGLDLKGVPAAKITVTHRGEQIPIYVESKGKFGPGDFLEFYGEALDTTYTDTNIYVVQVSSARASRIKEEEAKPAAKLPPQTSYTETLTVNNQRAFANYAPNEDAWYEKSLLAYTTSKTWEFPFEIRDLASTTSDATMTLVLWGATDWEDADPDHHVKVSINNTFVADQVFNGLVEQVIAITVPVGTLREGTNMLQLTLPGDTGVQWDMINLDKFSLTYQRLYRAENGQLTFTAAGQTFAVTNLPGRSVIVYRLDEKGKLERLKKILVQAEGDTFTATFAGTKNKASTYLVTTTDAILAPGIEATRMNADLDHPAQYLIIAHPDFINGLKPLIQARQAQGLTVSVVDVTDLYAQYSYGIFDPQAIKDYIAFAARDLGTEYVLLVGGDTYDYRNYLGVNSISFIPSLYARTSEIAKFVPVDPSYADIDGNNVPDVAIGRFPVRTAAELDLLVNKTLAYQVKNYGNTATFVSDKLDGSISFKNMSNHIASGLPSNWTVESIHIDDVGVSTARTRLLSAMNRGTALITFTGHSGPQKWTFSGLFGYKDPANLTNAGKPFVVVQWGCWNTYHVDPIYKYMVQSFLFPGDKGAVAVLGASTLTDSDSEEKLGILLQPRLTIPGMPIGKALLDAKIQLAKTDPELLDVLLGWTLMGDPALVIQP